MKCIQLSTNMPGIGLVINQHRNCGVFSELFCNNLSFMPGSFFVLRENPQRFLIRPIKDVVKIRRKKRTTFQKKGGGQPNIFVSLMIISLRHSLIWFSNMMSVSHQVSQSDLFHYRNLFAFYHISMFDRLIKIKNELIMLYQIESQIQPQKKKLQ